MTEAEANSRQKELNADLGAAWEERDFYVAVQRKGGDWDVERRHAKLTRRERMWRLASGVLAVFLPAVSPAFVVRFSARVTSAWWRGRPVAPGAGRPGSNGGDALTGTGADRPRAAGGFPVQRPSVGMERDARWFTADEVPVSEDVPVSEGAWAPEDVSASRNAWIVEGVGTLEQLDVARALLVAENVAQPGTQVDC